MANVSFSVSTHTVYWTISGLGNPFNTTYYTSAGITQYTFPQSAASVSGIVSSKTATNSGTSTSVSGSFMVSTPGTYVYYAYAQAANGMYYSAGSDMFVIEDDSITKWSWSASNGSATADQTQAAYTALTTKGPMTNFSYMVWNDMCDKVYQVTSQAGASWNSKYATYPNTKCLESDKVLTAARWNSLLHNVKLNTSVSTTYRNSGDIVYGTYFTTLMSAVNSWIDSL